MAARRSRCRRAVRGEGARHRRAPRRDGTARGAHPLALRIALQDPCHVRHAQRLPLAAAASLARIPELEIVEPAEQDLCCGSAGVYNVLQPEAARELGDRKAAHVLATGAAVYAAANPGCLVQVSSALRARGTAVARAASDRTRRRVDLAGRAAGASARARAARRVERKTVGGACPRPPAGARRGGRHRRGPGRASTRLRRRRSSPHPR